MGSLVSKRIGTGEGIVPNIRIAGTGLAGKEREPVRVVEDFVVGPDGLIVGADGEPLEFDFTNSGAPENS